VIEYVFPLTVVATVSLLAWFACHPVEDDDRTL